MTARRDDTVTHTTRRISDIPKTDASVPDDASVFEWDGWNDAPPLDIDVYPWYVSGEKQKTEARLLAAGDALHIRFVAEDAHISAEPRELNGPVCRDSCVEFFAAPFADRPDAYFNCEINCCGALLFGFGEDMETRRCITREEADELDVRTTVPGATKDESPDDDGWSAYARLPLDLLSRICGDEVRLDGTWTANCYRCGGKTDPQYACWNPLDNPRPNFHLPLQFGEIRFV